jgi:hypothetical protein
MLKGKVHAIWTLCERAQVEEEEEEEEEEGVCCRALDSRKHNSGSPVSYTQCCWP